MKHGWSLVPTKSSACKLERIRVLKRAEVRYITVKEYKFPQRKWQGNANVHDL